MTQLLSTFDPTVFNDYVPYLGATADVYLGTRNLLTSGTLGAGATTVTTLNATTSLTVVSLSGLLKGTSGVVSAITATTSADFLGGDFAVHTLNQAAVDDLMTSDSPTFTGATLSGLTTGRVVYTNTGGQLTNSGNLLFDGTNAAQTGYSIINGGVSLGSVGTAPSITSGILRVEHNTNSTSALKAAGFITMNLTANSSIGSGFMTGVNQQLYWLPAFVGGTVSTRSMTGISSAVNKINITTADNETKNFTCTTGTVFSSQITTVDGASATGVPKFTTAYNFRAVAPSLSTLGAITTLYAFYDAGQAVSGVTTAWGLAINTQSYINASLSIGKATAPTVPLDVVGAILNTTTIEAGTGFRCGGTAACADNTYALPTSITTKGGIIVSIS